jgi:ABC-type Fe3+/spermidine/putrescine transport system ATPase subunit
VPLHKESAAPLAAGARPDATETPRSVALAIRNLTKRYEDVIALDGIDLSIQTGDFVTILGPSGSGKTTLLKLLAGFEGLTHGEISLRGENISQLPPARREIGMVFQNYALFPHMTVGENIAYGLRMRRWRRNDRDARVRELLALVNLEGLEARYPRQLSGGQQQRVALARSLAFKPTLLLMDEPLGALDRALRFAMAEHIRRLHRQLGTTMLYVTHDREEALTLADRIVIMRDGRILGDGTPYELYHTPTNAFVASFFGGHNVVPVELDELVESTGRVRVIWEGQTRDVSGTIREGYAASLVIPRRAIRVGILTDLGAAVPARVGEILFIGGAYRINLMLERSGLLVIAEIPDDLEMAYNVGDHVVTSIDWEQVVIVER